MSVSEFLFSLVRHDHLQRRFPAHFHRQSSWRPVGQTPQGHLQARQVQTTSHRMETQSSERDDQRSFNFFFLLLTIFIFSTLQLSLPISIPFQPPIILYVLINHTHPVTVCLEWHHSRLQPFPGRSTITHSLIDLLGSFLSHTFLCPSTQHVQRATRGSLSSSSLSLFLLSILNCTISHHHPHHQPYHPFRFFFFSCRT